MLPDIHLDLMAVSSPSEYIFFLPYTYELVMLDIIEGRQENESGSEEDITATSDIVAEVVRAPLSKSIYTVCR